MEKQAEVLWLRLKILPTTDQRVEAAYRLLFARPPTPAEKQVAERFLARAENSDTPAATTANPEARLESQWKDYLQALLGLNEFHFVD